MPNTNATAPQPALSLPKGLAFETWVSVAAPQSTPPQNTFVDLLSKTTCQAPNGLISMKQNEIDLAC